MSYSAVPLSFRDAEAEQLNAEDEAAALRAEVSALREAAAMGVGGSAGDGYLGAVGGGRGPEEWRDSARAGGMESSSSAAATLLARQLEEERRSLEDERGRAALLMNSLQESRCGGGSGVEGDVSRWRYEGCPDRGI